MSFWQKEGFVKAYRKSIPTTISVIVLLILFLFPATPAFAINPPTGLNVAAGASPNVNLTWTAPGGQDHHRVYRALSTITDANKPGAKLLSDDTSTESYTDSTGIPGERYYYQVTAVDANGNESLVSTSVTNDNAIVAGSEDPHYNYSDLTGYCDNCHKVHLARSNVNVYRRTPSIDICYVCHDGTGSTYDIQNTYGGLAAHDTALTTPSSDIKCIYCHYPHDAPSPTRYTWLAKDSEENLCLTDGCHDNAAHDKSTTILNWNIYNQFQLSSHHAITGTTGDGLTGAKIECSSCHGPHTVKYSATSLEKVSNPDNTFKLANASGTGISEITDFCLKCHDETAPSQTWGSSATFVPYTITFPDVTSYPFFTGWNKSAFKTKIHYTAQSGDDKQCTRCHHPHGTDNDCLVEESEENMCYDCHSAAGGTTLFEDDFESGSLATKSWTVVNDGGFVGIANTEVHGGTYCVKYYGDDVGADCKSITTPDIDVTGYTTLTLTYWYRIEDLESGDEAHLDIYDGSWHTDVKGPYLDDNGQHSTSSGDYIKETVDLSGYNKVSNFKIKFRCTAVHVEASDTWLLDDMLFTGSTAAAAPDIDSVLDKNYKHPVETYSARHSNTETASGLAEANKHSECVDCHNPHDADSSAPIGSVGGVQKGGTTINPASYEYEVCFKCHTNNNGGLTGHTNKSDEFNGGTRNAWHPVANIGKNLGIKDGAFVEGTPWNPTSGDDADYSASSEKMSCGGSRNTSGAFVTCGCHGNDSYSSSDAQGPHGSGLNHILIANADTSSGSPSSSDICFKCHNWSTYYDDGYSGTAVNTRFEHAYHIRRGYNCTEVCHQNVVHGSDYYHFMRSGYTHYSDGGFLNTGDAGCSAGGGCHSGTDYPDYNNNY